jgi:hypothetical protein
MPDPFVTLLQRALAQGSRSTVLNPLGWLTGICATASIAAFSCKSPAWLGIMFGSLAGISIILYLVAYIYFGLTDKDALRSERFSIQKMAIQKGFIGDNLSGYFKVTDTLHPPALPSMTDQKEPGNR